MIALFMVLLVEPILILYHGKVFGVLRSLRGCHPFCGQLHVVRFSQLITLLRGVYSWSIGVVCVIVVGK